MKILYYSAHPHLNLSAQTGYGIHMREVISEFRKLDIEVFPVINGGTELKTNDSSSAQSSQKSLIKKLLPSIVWQTLRDVQLLKIDRRLKNELKEQIRKIEPDLIYERGYYLMSSGVNAAAELKIPIIIETNAPYPEERIKMEGYSLISGLANSVIRKQLKTAQKFVVVSEALKLFYSKKLEGEVLNIVATPNGISEEILIEASKTPTDSLELEDTLKGKFVIGFVGSIFPYHGVETLIKSFIDVSETYLDVELVVVGDGEILPELMAKYNGNKRIHFTGKVEHSIAKQLIRTFDIAVMASSNWYGSPVKIFEYGAYSKAVIAPSTGPVEEVITEGENGLLITPDSVDKLTEAIKMLRDNPELREKLGKQLHKSIENQFLWKHTVQKILAGINYKE